MSTQCFIRRVGGGVAGRGGSVGDGQAVTVGYGTFGSIVLYVLLVVCALIGMFSMQAVAQATPTGLELSSENDSGKFDNDRITNFSLVTGFESEDGEPPSAGFQFETSACFRPRRDSMELRFTNPLGDSLPPETFHPGFLFGTACGDVDFVRVAVLGNSDVDSFFLDDGKYTVEAVIIDSDIREESDPLKITLTIDRLGPEVTFTPGSQPGVFTVSATDVNGVDTFEVATSVGVEDCNAWGTSPNDFSSYSSGTTHTVVANTDSCFKAVDIAGNVTYATTAPTFETFSTWDIEAAEFADGDSFDDPLTIDYEEHTAGVDIDDIFIPPVAKADREDVTISYAVAFADLDADDPSYDCTDTSTYTYNIDTLSYDDLVTHGKVRVCAKATDAGGNVGYTPFASEVLTIEYLEIPIPTEVTLHSNSDSGVVDGITNTPADQPFTFTVAGAFTVFGRVAVQVEDPAGATVTGDFFKVVAGGETSNIDVVVDAGTFTIDGEYAITATQTVDGRTSEVSDTYTLVIDRTAPVITVKQGTTPGTFIASATDTSGVATYGVAADIPRADCTADTIGGTSFSPYNVVDTHTSSASTNSCFKATDIVGNSSYANTIDVIGDYIRPFVENGSTLRSDNSNSPNFAKEGDTITLIFTVSEALASTPTVAIAGRTARVTLDSENTYIATLKLGSANRGQVAYNIGLLTDLVGNTFDPHAITLGGAGGVVVDRTAPEVHIIIDTWTDPDEATSGREVDTTMGNDLSSDSYWSTFVLNVTDAYGIRTYEVATEVDRSDCTAAKIGDTVFSPYDETGRHVISPYVLVGKQIRDSCFKVTDNAGNVSYKSTKDAVFDTINPVIITNPEWKANDTLFPNGVFTIDYDEYLTNPTLEDIFTPPTATDNAGVATIYYGIATADLDEADPGSVCTGPTSTYVYTHNLLSYDAIAVPGKVRVCALVEDGEENFVYSSPTPVLTFDIFSPASTSITLHTDSDSGIDDGITYIPRSRPLVFTVAGTFAIGDSVDLQIEDPTGTAVSGTFTKTVASGETSSIDIAVAAGTFTTEGEYTVTATHTAGNQTSYLAAYYTFTADNIAPSIDSVTLTSNNSDDDTMVNLGDTLTLSFTVSETLASDPIVTIAEQSATVTAGQTPNTYLARIIVTNSIKRGAVSYDISPLIDIAGNAFDPAKVTPTGAEAVLVEPILPPDTTSPSIVGDPTLRSNNSTTTLAKVGDTITLSFVVSEELGNTPSVNIAGNTATVARDTNSTTRYTATYQVTSATTEGQVVYNIATLTDTASNTYDPTPVTLTGADGVVVDHTAPAVTVAPGTASDTFTASATDTNGSGVATYGVADSVSESDCTAANIGNTSFSVYTEGDDHPVSRGTASCFKVTDVAGNVAYAIAVEAADTTNPSIVGTPTLRSNNSTTTVAKAGETITLSFVVSEELGSNPSATIAGETATVVKTVGSDTEYTATYQVTSSTTNGQAAYDIGALTDLASNTYNPAPVTLTGSAGVFVDRTPPVITVAAGTASNTFAVSATDTNGSEITFFGVATNVPAANCTAANIGETIFSNHGSHNDHPVSRGSASCFKATDAAGNVAYAIAAVAADTTNPAIVGNPTLRSNNSTTTLAKVGDTITLSFIVSEELESDPTVAIAGDDATVESTGNVYTATYEVTGSTTEGQIAYDIAILTDLASNTFDPIAVTLTGSAGVFVDRTDPVFTASPSWDTTASQFPNGVLTIDYAEHIVPPVIGDIFNTATATDDRGVPTIKYAAAIADIAPTEDCSDLSVYRTNVGFFSPIYEPYGITDLSYTWDLGIHGKTRVCARATDAAGNIAYSDPTDVLTFDFLPPRPTSVTLLDAHNSGSTRDTITNKPANEPFTFTLAGDFTEDGTVDLHVTSPTDILTSISKTISSSETSSVNVDTDFSSFGVPITQGIPLEVAVDGISLAAGVKITEITVGLGTKSGFGGGNSNINLDLSDLFSGEIDDTASNPVSLFGATGSSRIALLDGEITIYDETDGEFVAIAKLADGTYQTIVVKVSATLGDNENPTAIVTGAQYEVSSSDISAVDGTYTVTATHTVGDYTSLVSPSYDIIIDRTAPVVTVAAGSASGTFTVSATDTNGIDKYEVVASTTEANCTATGTATSTFESYTADSTHTITGGTTSCFKVTDVAGNVAYASTVVTAIDNTPPTFSTHPRWKTNANIFPNDEHIINNSDHAGSPDIADIFVVAVASDSNPVTPKYAVATTIDGTDPNADCANAAYAYTITTLTYADIDTEGKTRVCARATDSTGNVAHSTSTPVLTVDLTNPSVNRGTTVVSNNSTNNRFATIDNTITVTFTTSEPLASTPTVTIAGDDATVTNPSGNTYRAIITVDANTDVGKVKYDIGTLTDTVGNTSNPGEVTSFGITVDTINPVFTVSPSWNTNASQFPGGVLTIDYDEHTASPAIEGILNLATVTDTNNFTLRYAVATSSSVPTATCSNESVYTYNISNIGYDLIDTEGKTRVCARAVDAAGNVAYSTATDVLTVDLTPPANVPDAPTGVTLGSTSDTGAKGDNITRTPDTLYLIVTGSFTEGGAVALQLKDPTNTAVSGTFSKTVGSNETARISVDIESSNFTTDGVYTVTATQTVSDQTSTPSPAYTFTVDNTAPVFTSSPLWDTSASQFPSGVLTIDYSEHTASPEISDIFKAAVATDESSAVTLRYAVITHSLSFSLDPPTSCANGTYRYDITTVSYSDIDTGGKTRVCARAVDAAGNVTYSTATDVLTVNSTPPPETTPPSIVGVPTLVTNNTNTRVATVGDTITLSFRVSEDLRSNPSVAIAGQPARVSRFRSFKNRYTATYEVTSSTTNGWATYDIGTLTDSAGNTFDPDPVTLTGSRGVVVDRTAPAFIAPPSWNTNASQFSDGALTIDYTEHNVPPVIEFIFTPPTVFDITVSTLKYAVAHTANGTDPSATCSDTTTYTYDLTTVSYDDIGIEGKIRVCARAVDAGGNTTYSAATEVLTVDLTPLAPAPNPSADNTPLAITIGSFSFAGGGKSAAYPVTVVGTGTVTTQYLDNATTCDVNTTGSFQNFTSTSHTFPLGTQTCFKATDGTGDVVYAITPKPPTIALITTHDTGSSATDGITNRPANSSFTFQITGSFAVDQLVGFFDASANSLGTKTIVTGEESGFQFTIPNVASAYGVSTTHEGNLSFIFSTFDVGVDYEFVIDRTAPDATITIGEAADTFTTKATDTNGIDKYEVAVSTVVASCNATGTTTSTFSPYTAEDIHTITGGTASCFKIIDVAGNTTYASTGAAVITDIISPAVNSGTTVVSNNATDDDFATIDDVITLTFTVSETLASTPSVTIAGDTAAVTNPSGDTYVAVITVDADTDEGAVKYDIDTLTDEVSNIFNPPEITTRGNTLITVDTTPPTFSSSPSWDTTASQFSGGVRIDSTEHVIPPKIGDLFKPAVVTDTHTWTLQYAVATSSSNPPARCSNAVYTYNLTTVSYADIDTHGKTRVCAKATDAAGNETYSIATAVLTVDLLSLVADTAPPIITFGTFAFNSGFDKVIYPLTIVDANSFFVRYLDNATSCDANTVGSFRTTTSTSHTFPLGTQTCFKATDSFGNTGYAITPKPPTVTLIATHDTGSSSTDGITNRPANQTFTFQVTGSFIAGQNVRFFDGDYNLIGNRTIVTGEESGFQYVVAGDTFESSATYEGSVALLATFLNAGNSYSFIVDRTAPDVTVDSGGTAGTYTAAATDTNGIDKYEVVASTVATSCTAVGTSRSIFSPYTEGNTHTITGGVPSCFKVTDTAGNVTYKSTDLVASDTTLPAIVGTPTLRSNNGTTTVAKAGDTITLAFVVSEELESPPSVRIAGDPASVARESGSTTNYTATYQVTNSTANGQATYNIGTLTDLANNTFNPDPVTLTGSAGVLVDRVAPTVNSGTTVVSNNTTSTSVAIIGNTITVTFTTSEALASDPAVTIARKPATVVAGTEANTYIATITVDANTDTGVVKYDIGVLTDTIGNTFDPGEVTTSGGTLVTVAASAVFITDTTTVVSNNTTDTKFATIDDVITLTFTANSTLESTPTAIIAGQEANVVAGTEANTYIATITVDADTEIGVVKYDIGALTDTVGNTFNQGEVTTSGDILVTVDTTDPTLTVEDTSSGAISTDRTFTITASDTNAVNVAYLDNVDSCTAQTSGTYTSLTLTSGTTTRVVEANEQDCFKATDAAGNTTFVSSLVALPSQSLPAAADTTAPTFTLDYAGSPTIENNTGYYNTSTLTTGGVTVSNLVEENLATAVLTLARTDTTGVSNLIPASAIHSITGAVSFANITSVPNGTYTATVVLTDVAGNQTTKTLDLVVDIAAPTITSVTIDNPSSRSSVKAAIAVTHNQTFSEILTVTLAGQRCIDLNPITFTGSGTSTTDVGLRGRIATFNCTITLTDQAGNTSNSFTVPTFTIERNRSSGSSGGGGGGSSGGGGGSSGGGGGSGGSSGGAPAAQAPAFGTETPQEPDPVPPTPQTPQTPQIPPTPPTPQTPGTEPPQAFILPTSPIPAPQEIVYEVRGTFLSLGSVGIRVRTLQQFLNQNGYPVSTQGVGSSGQETTYFGPATRRALIAFQTAQGLPATGTLDAQTQEAIVSYQREAPQNDLQQQITTLKLALARILQRIQELIAQKQQAS